MFFSNGGIKINTNIIMGEISGGKVVLIAIGTGAFIGFLIWLGIKRSNSDKDSDDSNTSSSDQGTGDDKLATGEDAANAKKAKSLIDSFYGTTREPGWTKGMTTDAIIASFKKDIDDIDLKYKAAISEMYMNAKTKINELKLGSKLMNASTRKNETERVNDELQADISAQKLKRNEDVARVAASYPGDAVFKCCLELCAGNKLELDVSEYTKPITAANSDLPVAPQGQGQGQGPEPETVNSTPPTSNPGLGGTKESFCSGDPGWTNKIKSDERDVFSYTTFNYYALQNPDYWTSMAQNRNNQYDNEIARNLCKYNKVHNDYMQ